MIEGGAWRALTGAQARIRTEKAGAVQAVGERLERQGTFARGIDDEGVAEDSLLRKGGGDAS